MPPPPPRALVQKQRGVAGHCLPVCDRCGVDRPNRPTEQPRAEPRRPPGPSSRTAAILRLSKPKGKEDREARCKWNVKRRTYPSDMSALSRARYDSQRLPTTLPHEKQRTGMICRNGEGETDEEDGRDEGQGRPGGREGRRTARRDERGAAGGGRPAERARVRAEARGTVGRVIDWRVESRWPEGGKG